MLKYITATALLWFIVRINMGIDLQAYHQEATGYLAHHQMALFAWTGIWGIASYGLIYLMDIMGLHSAMYVVAKFLLETSKLLISLVFVGSLFLYFDVGANLWTDLKLIMIMPLLVLATAILCIRLFDFNFPIQDTVITCLTTPLFCGIIILGSLYLGL
ncbi:MAG: hypothetical protein V1706_15615 [Pseudomonadota bacterium]